MGSIRLEIRDATLCRIAASFLSVNADSAEPSRTHEVCGILGELD
jgi:hypothetical protein